MIESILTPGALFAAAVPAALGIASFPWWIWRVSPDPESRMARWVVRSMRTEPEAWSDDGDGRLKHVNGVVVHSSGYTRVGECNSVVTDCWIKDAVRTALMAWHVNRHIG